MKAASIAITIVLVIGLVINVVASNSGPVSYTPAMAEQDRCVPTHSAVLSLAVQKVNNIVNPECA